MNTESLYEFDTGSQISWSVLHLLNSFMQNEYFSFAENMRRKPPTFNTYLLEITHYDQLWS